MINYKSPFAIENIYPSVNDGRFPVKREVGNSLTVEASAYRDGHFTVVILLKYREKYNEEAWHETEMKLINPGLDRWQGSFKLERNTRYLYTVEAFTDFYHSWLKDTIKKFDAKEDIQSDLLEGLALVEKAASQAKSEAKRELDDFLNMLKSAELQKSKIKIFSDNDLLELMKANADRSDSCVYEPAFEVVADRVEARFAAWYEIFPRSQGSNPNKSATFEDCKKRLPEIQDMGFDVVYLTPIHPIGLTNRKGKNNSLTAKPGEPGSPYAIGSHEGGHFAVEPGLGSLEDFRDFEQACRSLNMEVALDFAINCSPDHPYVKEHPDWFFKRPDGTIKYAENPPKKYQDIYPLNFYAPNDAWKALWEEMKNYFLFWAKNGVRIFRVDNPHTKPIPFWEWIIEGVQQQYPDVIFLSEAFTRPPMMKMLAKVGFTQSYTYFTWRNFKAEIIDYLTELTQSEAKEYMRGNLFANTPDILPQFLQEGGRPAFMLRFVLAATLSSVYGIYSGYELCENEAVPGKEEYLNSEKYEFKVWDWDRPGHIKDLIATVNRIRKENPALHLYKNLRFYHSDNDNVLFYGKATEDKKNAIFVAVNLDPFNQHQSGIYVPIQDFNIKPNETYELHNLITGARMLCKGEKSVITLDPETDPAHIYRLEKWLHREEDFDYFAM
jgi:starch synthase (maltosyl-transferring)